MSRLHDMWDRYHFNPNLVRFKLQFKKTGLEIKKYFNPNLVRFKL